MKKIFSYDFSNDQSTLATATLNVKISEYNNFPLVIRKSNFQLQGYSKTDKAIVLDPGIYIIEAVKPDGDLESKIVDLKTGDFKELELTFIPEKNIKREKGILEEAFIPDAPESKSFDLSPKASSTLNPFKMKRKNTFTTNKLDLMVRILFFDNNDWQVEKELLENVDYSTETIDDVDHIGIDISASEHLQILEVCRPKGESTYMVLPLHNNSNVRTCTVEIWDDEVDFQLSCYFEYSKRATLMLDYLSSNSFEQVSDIVAEEAEDMLYSKMIKPIEAVIGGYALLRIGAIERMHHWPRNLYKWFPELADGAIIAGELEARKGNDKEAIDLFLEAYHRGLPIFREGLSLLVARLRSYLLYEKELSINDKKLKELKSAYLYLAKLSMFSNNAYELLVINGLSLIDDQDLKKNPNV